MNGTHPNGILTLKASGAIEKGDIVLRNGGKAVRAGASGATGALVGAALDAAADGTEVPVALFGAHPGTMLVKASSGVTGAVGGYMLQNGAVVDSAPNSTGGTVIGRVVAPADADGLVEIAHVVPVHYA